MRTFLALDLPNPVRQHLATVIDTLAQRIPGVRWVKPNGLHVTLKFIGEIDEVKLKGIQSALEGINNYRTAMPAQLRALDAFPSLIRPRIIVATMNEEVDNIKTMFHDIEHRLETVGIEKEQRGFVPHITLGRVKNPAPILKQHIVPLYGRRFYLETLILYRSTLTREGALYDPLSEIRFRKDDNEKGRD